MNPTLNRPYAVTIVLWGVFLFGIWNMGRAFAIYQQRSLLIELTEKPDPRLRLVIAFIWAILFWGCTFALWQRRPFTRKIIPILILVYAVYDLSLPLLFAQTTLAQHRWLMSGVFYSIIVLFGYMALNSLHKKSYFEKEKLEVKD